MPLIRNFSYRPEIDGLRALAVLAVVFFHAGFGCPGGYVGVDVFFVISGFLISTLIWKDLEAGAFSPAVFWERRFRRIGPALIVVALAVLLVGFLVMLPGDLKSLGRAAASQALFLANVHYWLDTGYFVGEAEEKPLLHTWSLAVEEQFYLLAPLALWGLYRSKAFNSRAAVLGVIVAGFFGSLALSVHGLARAPGATFYLLPTRAWELLLGAAIAFLPAQQRIVRAGWQRELLQLSGLVLIVIPVFAYTSTTRFPGLAALPPTVGTALLLWSHTGGPDRTAVTKFLSFPPVVFIGLISYSLYLWHWPLLAFTKYLAPANLSVSWRGIILLCGFGCALLSWKFVEKPFRERKIGARPRALWVFTGAGLASVFALGALCWSSQGFPGRFPPEMLTYADTSPDPRFSRELTPDDIREGRLVPLGVSNPSVAPSVLVWGDSHATAALPAIDEFLKERGLSGGAITHSATAPVLGWFFRSKMSGGSGLDQEAIAYNEAAFRYLRDHKIPHVILIASWSYYLTNDLDAGSPFRPALLETIRKIGTAGARPWLMMDVPVHSCNIPKVLSLFVDGHRIATRYSARPSRQVELENDNPNFLAKVEVAGGTILDPKPSFLNETGDRYLFQKCGVLLYRDNAHLTTKGAKLILTPFFHRNFHPEPWNKI